MRLRRLLENEPRSAIRAVNHNLAALHVERSGIWIARGLRPSSTDGFGIREVQRAKVGDVIPRAQNPLGVRQTKAVRRAELLDMGLLIGEILDHYSSGRRRISEDSHSDAVRSRDGDVRELLWVVRIPLVPSFTNGRER